MREIDISDKIKRIIKFGLPSLILIAVVASSLIWYATYGSNDIVVRNARVSGNVVNVRVRVNGSIEDILVNDGDEVKAGDVVARIRVNITEEQIKQLEQTVELTERNLEQIKQGVVVQVPRTSTVADTSSADVEKAKKRMERMEQLYEMGAISAVKRDEAIAQYQALAAAAPATQSVTTMETTYRPPDPEVVRKAELQVRQAQAALERAKKNAEATEIVAPVDGAVYIGDLAVGEEVFAGQSIAGIGKSDNMWVEAWLDVDQRDKVRLGQVVDYYIDRVKYEGLVVDISDPEEMENNNPANTEGAGLPQNDKLVVRISIPQEAMEAIKFGETAEVRFLHKG